MGAGSTMLHVAWAFAWVCYGLLVVIGCAEIIRSRNKDYARVALGASHAAVGCLGAAVTLGSIGRNATGLWVVGIIFMIYMILSMLVAFQDHKFPDPM